MFRDSKFLKDPARGKILLQLNNYIDQVINVEWPLMVKGQNVNDTDFRGSLYLENISSELFGYGAANSSQSLLVTDMLSQINQLHDARQQRIRMSLSFLNGEIWLVIIIGTILTIGINCLDIYLHIVALCIAALMASSVIFLLVTLDRPFQGEFAIKPDAFFSVKHYIAKDVLLLRQNV